MILKENKQTKDIHFGQILQKTPLILCDRKFNSYTWFILAGDVSNLYLHSDNSVLLSELK